MSTDHPNLFRHVIAALVTNEPGVAYDVPQTWDHLYAEGKPYYWHYRREPYRIY